MRRRSGLKPPSPVRVVHHVYADVAHKTRKSLLNTLSEISCIVNQLGVDRAFIKKKFGTLLKYGYYGEAHGVRRVVTDIFVAVDDANTAVAFSVVCAFGEPPMFHRLRTGFVKESVYVALLCGTGATEIMDLILDKYETKWITLDSLPHVIGYYLRPAFGEGHMIDSRESFSLSQQFRDTYRKFVIDPDATREEKADMRMRRDAATLSVTEKMERTIQSGEMFVPRVESASRRTSGSQAVYNDYLCARIAYPPRTFQSSHVGIGLGDAFSIMCYDCPVETGRQEFLDSESWLPRSVSATRHDAPGASPDTLMTVVLTEKCRRMFHDWRKRGDGSLVRQYDDIHGRRVEEIVSCGIAWYSVSDLRRDIKDGLVELEETLLLD
jgi:hypothetical protein